MRLTYQQRLIDAYPLVGTYVLNNHTKRFEERLEILNGITIRAGIFSDVDLVLHCKKKRQKGKWQDNETNMVFAICQYYIFSDRWCVVT